MSHFESLWKCTTLQCDETSERPGTLQVPTGVAVFPAEIYRSPRSWAAALYNIQHWSVFPRGGHFAALEAPAELTADIRTFFAANH